MSNIQVIEPTQLHLPRVAAYCRVSTEKEEQEYSLESQIAHFTQLIHDNPEWEFTGVYAEQQTGLNVKGEAS